MTQSYSKVTQHWFEVTVELFFWEGNRSHCFMRWGDQRQKGEKYRNFRIIHHRPDKNTREIVTIHYAGHNPIDIRSYEVMVRTVLQNKEKLIVERL